MELSILSHSQREDQCPVLDDCTFEAAYKDMLWKEIVMKISGPRSRPKATV